MHVFGADFINFMSMSITMIKGQFENDFSYEVSHWKERGTLLVLWESFAIALRGIYVRAAIYESCVLKQLQRY